ncbi:MAG TPA: glycosyltransferase family 2 protein [Flavobacteriaceae bacterium]|nr:glycosyltransferase family 2 protein [Flavobacteriaceae bacterium]
MLLSIITINYNNCEGLERTLVSVCGQEKGLFEYIVIDGGSTDGSKDLIVQYEKGIDFWISEQDSGVYEAMNKGIRRAHGSYLLFLNSGDALVENSLVGKVLEKIDGDDLYYGDLICTSPNQQYVANYPNENELTIPFLYKKSLPHPATFIKKALFEAHFFYSESYKIVSDWEFFMYVILKGNASFKHLGMPITYFDETGMSNNKEYRKVLQNEKRLVMEHRFPLLLKLLEEKERQERWFSSKRFQLLKELENSKIARRLNALWLRTLYFLFHQKK